MNLLRNSINQTRKFQRRRVNVNGIDEIWYADLIDMQAFSNKQKWNKILANCY